MIRSGEYTKRVRIEQKSVSADGYGGFNDTWAVFDVVYAKVTTSGGAESQQNGRQMPTNAIEIETRYRPGITTAMRAVYSSRYFDITSVVNENERNEKLILTCVERVGEGATA